jgi:large subunit ribosomal protein L31
MKQDTHPQVNNVIFEDASTGARFFSTSTLDSEKRETIDGVEYHVIQVEISSTSHPFFTGKKVLVDTAGQVDKFKQRFGKANKDAVEKKKAKKTQRSEKKKETTEA